MTLNSILKYDLEFNAYTSVFVKMRSGLPWTSPDFYYFFVEMMSDKVILDLEKFVFGPFENFHYFVIFSDFSKIENLDDY